MDNLLELSERPAPEELYMIAGWRQWADAGDTSSGLPEYLVDMMGARKIGQIKSAPFYFFQVPGTHDFLRPEIKMENGYRQELRTHKNEIYYSGDEHKGLVIFLGDEPHLNVERYAEAFFAIAQELKVKRVAAVGGVYGTVPYDKDRHISCSYSQRGMKAELDEYALQFSNYEGGATIGSYLTDLAEKLGIEYMVLYALVPMYDLSELSSNLQSMTVEQDWKAWYDLMRRFNHMFKLGLDLTDLEQHSRELVESVAEQIEELETKAPEVDVKKYVQKLNENFAETSFLPLDDVWERGLGDLLDDIDE